MDTTQQTKQTQAITTVVDLQRLRIQELQNELESLRTRYARLMMAVKDSGPGVFVDVFENVHGDTYYLGYKQGDVIMTHLLSGPEQVSPTGVKYSEVCVRVLDPETRTMRWEPRGYLVTDDSVLGFTLPTTSALSTLPRAHKSIRESIFEAIDADQHTAAEIIAYVCSQISARETSVRTQLYTLASAGVLERRGTSGHYEYYDATPETLQSTHTP